MFDRLDLCKVPIVGRLVDAMHALESGAAEIALALDHDDRLVGTLTDGDVRRALLKGASLGQAAVHVRLNFGCGASNRPDSHFVHGAHKLIQVSAQYGGLPLPEHKAGALAGASHPRATPLTLPRPPPANAPGRRRP